MNDAPYNPHEFLHRHPGSEARISMVLPSVIEGHVVVDEADWHEARKLRDELKALEGQKAKLEAELETWKKRYELMCEDSDRDEEENAKLRAQLKTATRDELDYIAHNICQRVNAEGGVKP